MLATANTNATEKATVSSQTGRGQSASKPRSLSLREYVLQEYGSLDETPDHDPLTCVLCKLERR